MQNRPIKRKSGFAGFVLRLLGAIVLALAVGACPPSGQKGEPPNPPGPEDPCADVGIREVSLEIDMSESVSALDHWLDINYGGELRKAFRACCTEFVRIRPAYDELVDDYPDDYNDLYIQGNLSWDMEYDATMHLILAMKVGDKEVLGYTWSYGPAWAGSSSWVFVQRIDELLEDRDSHASRKAFSTREATHELGHHRAYLEDACYKANEEYYVNSSHYNEEFDLDRDCVMASPFVEEDGLSVWSVCGSGRPLLYDIYFCYGCRESVKSVLW